MTNAATYTPQPGTIPARVIAYLNQLPPGTELATAVLAEAVEVIPSAVQATLGAPMKHGAVICTKRDGINYWRLGAGIPAAHLQASEPDDAPVIQRVIPAATAPRIQLPPPAPATKPARRTAKKPKAAPRPAPAPTHQLVPIEPARPPMRLAVWSDGSLAIERGPERVDFTLDETRQIVRYLERMAATEGSA